MMGIKKRKFSLADYQLFTLADEQIQPAQIVHLELRRLTKEQKKLFFNELYQITLYSSAAAKIDQSTPNNEDIQIALKAIQTHIQDISLLIGNGISFLAILTETVIDNPKTTLPEDIKQVENFIDTLHALPTVYKLISLSLQKPCKHKLPKTDIYIAIAAAVGNLLDKYGLKKTVATNGLWVKSINQVIKDANLPIKKDPRNYIRSCKSLIQNGCKIPKKNSA